MTEWHSPYNMNEWRSPYNMTEWCSPYTMNPSDGPSAQKTCTATRAACCEQMRESTSCHEENILTLIASTRRDGPSASPRTSRSRASPLKEQRRNQSTSSQDDKKIARHRNVRETLHCSNDEWIKMADKWSARAEKTRAELINFRRKFENGLNELHMEVENLIQATTEMMDELSNL